MMGSLAFCRDNAEFTLVQTMEQHSWHSYLTKGSAKLLNELDCGMQLLLDDTFVLKGIKDFPGLYVIYAGGHTLGSQIFVAHINEGARIERIFWQAIWLITLMVSDITSANRQHIAVG